MRMSRTLLGAATVLTLPLMAACTATPGGGPRPPAAPQDCGRIDLSAPNSGDAAKVRCYNQYHLPPFPAVQLVTVESVNGGTVTRTFRSPGGTHKMTITTVTVDASGRTTTTVRDCGADGAPFDATKGQTFLDDRGRIVLQSC